MDQYDGHNATNIGLQADADAQLDPHINELLDYVKAHPPGRVYAGAPTNWGNDLTVGAVPVFKYLESKDIDEVGYTLRTASLMTDPEYFFDDTNPGDYPLFGIGYIITPANMPPPVPAHHVLCSGPYCLWSLHDPGYIHVYDTTGVLNATRANVGTQSTTLLDSPLLEHQRDLTVAFNGAEASQPTASGEAVRGSPGHVVTQKADLESGTAQALVHTTRRATVVLSASYDPGWHATVDGHPAPTIMVAPALVGVDVGPGRAHGGLQLRRVRLLHRPDPAGAGGLRCPRRCTIRVAAIRTRGAPPRREAGSARARTAPARAGTRRTGKGVDRRRGIEHNGRRCPRPQLRHHLRHPALSRLTSSSASCAPSPVSTSTPRSTSWRTTWSTRT